MKTSLFILSFCVTILLFCSNPVESRGFRVGIGFGAGSLGDFSGKNEGALGFGVKKRDPFELTEEYLGFKKSGVDPLYSFNAGFKGRRSSSGNGFGLGMGFGLDIPVLNIPRGYKAKPLKQEDQDGIRRLNTEDDQANLLCAETDTIDFIDSRIDNNYAELEITEFGGRCNLSEFESDAQLVCYGILTLAKMDMGLVRRNGEKRKILDYVVKINKGCADLRDLKRAGDGLDFDRNRNCWKTPAHEYGVDDLKSSGLSKEDAGRFYYSDEEVLQLEETLRGIYNTTKQKVESFSGLELTSQSEICFCESELCNQGHRASEMSLLFALALVAPRHCLAWLLKST